RLALSELRLTHLVGRTTHGVGRCIAQVPGDAVHAALLVRGKLAHPIAGRVVNPECRISTFGQRVAEEVRDDCTECRVRRRVLTIAERSGTADTARYRAVRVVLRRGFDR